MRYHVPTVTGTGRLGGKKGKKNTTTKWNENNQDIPKHQMSVSSKDPQPNYPLAYLFQTNSN